MELYTILIAALLIIKLETSCCFNVKWELLTNPVVANEEVMLSCYTNTALHNVTYAAWMKINNDILEEIAFKNSSTTSLKYKASISSQLETIHYNLIIRDFETADTNFQYRCILEFKEYTNFVALNESNFIRLPREDHILRRFSFQNESILIDIDMLHVFPKPSCHLVFERNNYTEYLTVISTHNSSMCYNTKIQYLIPNNMHSLCRGTIEIVCYVLTREVNIKRGEINVCTNDSTKQSSAVELTLAVILTLLLVIIVSLLLMKHRGRLNCNKKHATRMNSSMQCLNKYDDETQDE